MNRRSAPESLICFPDWIVSHRLSRDLTAVLLRYATGNLLDVGAGNVPYRNLLMGRLSSYTALDLEEGPGIDVVGSALALPFPPASFDVVFSSQVLEHVPCPQEMFREFARVIRPSGLVIISAPQYWPEHEKPFDYNRFTIHGMRELGRVAGFEMIDERRQGGGFAVAGQAINNVLAERLRFGDARVHRLRKLAMAALLFPVFTVVNVLFDLLDRMIASGDDTLNLVVVFRPDGRSTLS